MLYLLFHVGKDRYAVDSAEVVEVLPVVAVKHIPRAAPGIAGIFNYHGEPVPLIDVSALASGRSAPLRMSSRILLVNYACAGESHRLGLLVERATAVRHLSEPDFVDTGVTPPDAPFLGRVATDAGELVQRVEVQSILPPEACGQLFQRPEEPAGWITKRSRRSSQK